LNLKTILVRIILNNVFDYKPITSKWSKKKKFVLSVYIINSGCTLLAVVEDIEYSIK